MRRSDEEIQQTEDERPAEYLVLRFRHTHEEPALRTMLSESLQNMR